MPVDTLYWNPEDFGSEESLHEPTSKNYVDPWDLENYAYIREHLDSVDLSTDPSSSEEFQEANSTSFYYVPGNARKVSEIKNKAPPVPQPKRNVYDTNFRFDSIVTESGNYAAIDELKVYERNRPRSDYIYEANTRRVHSQETDGFDSDLEESPYEEDVKESSLYVYDNKDRLRKITIPSTIRNNVRDRSMSFSYGDYAYDPYSTRNEVYSRLNDVKERDTASQIYDHVRNPRRKPNNFGLSNYGHLKIDYSYSWNNLNKYIGS